MGTAYAVNLLRAALDEGVKYTHTSSSYAERNNERMLGEALKWVLQDEHVHTAIPAFSNFDELREDLEVVCERRCTLSATAGWPWPVTFSAHGHLRTSPAHAASDVM
jgi:aryl-alcohol dehydrogenase-like predicted oxidoreductase